MTDLVPVTALTASVPAVIFTPEERIVRLGDLGIARENLSERGAVLVWGGWRKGGRARADRAR